MVKEKRSLFMMIVPLMILMWLTSALLIWGMIPNLDFVRIQTTRLRFMELLSFL